MKKGMWLDGRSAPIQPHSFFHWGGAASLQEKGAEEEKRDNGKALAFQNRVYHLS
jgi:hypothetical protein